jgi:erythromycin esterase
MSGMYHRMVATALAVALALGAAASGACQASSIDPRVTWLAQHAIRFNSVSPADTDFSDLAPLKAFLRDASVVMLGEQSHGDGTTFLAKIRLTKYLHQELGFDVIAFESGLYDSWKAWQHLEAGGEPGEALQLGLFGLWSESEQVRPLGEYLVAAAATDRPLELAGFDIQPSGRASRELVGDLAAALRRIGSTAGAGDDWQVFTDIYERLAGRSYIRGDVALPSHEERERFAAAVASIRQEVRGAWPRQQSAELAMWVQILHGIGAYAQMIWLVNPYNLRPTVDDARIRDAQMAENLLWLARERYAGRKIVVWAATSHTARHLATVESGIPEVQTMYDSVPTFGERVWRALGDSVYSLGFTAYEGEAGNVFGTRWALSTPSTGSLEDLMHRAGLDNAIVDFRRPSPGRAWLDSVMVARPMGYGEMRARWSHVLDGMMFTRRMTPSTRVSEMPR